MDRELRLIDDASRGDSLAFEQLLARYLPEIRRRIERNVGALDAAIDGSDAAQSIARQALEHATSVEVRGAREFRNWLLTLAERKAVDYARRAHADCRDQRRRVSIDAGERGDGADDPPGGDPTPSRNVSCREERERVRAAIARLPDDLRESILLAQFEGLSYEAIAARLSITYKQARTRVAHAKAALARALADP